MEAEGGSFDGSRGSGEVGADMGADDGADEEGAAGMTAADFSDEPSGPFALLRLVGLI